MKNKIPVWVIVICVLGIMFYAILIFNGVFDSNTFKYEVQTDGTILIDKEKFTISSKLKSYYDEKKESFYIEGYLINNTKKIYHDIALDFVIYDLDGIILGNAYAYLEKIGENETWKFKAVYDDIDATDAVSYKLINVVYY